MYKLLLLSQVEEFARIDCCGRTFVGVIDHERHKFVAGELIHEIKDNDGNSLVEPIGSPQVFRSTVIETISTKAIEWLTQ